LSSTTCHGSADFAVHAYPPDQWSINLDLKKSLEALRKGIEKLCEILED
jgi:hypothetical protein